MHAAIGASHAAALSTFSDDPGPVAPSGPAGLAPLASVGPLSEEEAEARHAGVLASAGAERPWIVETRIVLQRHPDGSYTWQSSNFTATITAEGAVRFSDRGAVEFDLARGEGTFDLTDAIMRGAGADPFAYERQRFYDDNVELIETLDDAARVTMLRGSGAALRRRLSRIWRRGGSARSRRASLFEEWDECGDGPEEAPGRAIVIEFIRATLPEGSRSAFTPREIERFDSRRRSVEHFDPYASSSRSAE